LRFSRDKRGYENTFVVHTHGSGGRRRGKPRSRILYWFRTPPGVRIGRSALDEDAIRLIEEHNPDVEFDWTRILKGQDGSSEVRTGGQPDRRNRPRPREMSPRPAPDRRETPSMVEAPPPPHLPDHEELEAEPTEVSVPATLDADAVERVEPPEAAVIEEFLVEPRIEAPVARPLAGDALSAVEARLGSEGLSRLRARYSEVLARISETIADPGRQEELKLQAERLNPDTWVTEAEVGAGLESYESVFESLRSVVGRRRRRRRRGSERPRENVSQDSPKDAPEETAGPGEMAPPEDQ
jgi:hypothetical protein